jgi:hypothetical protein
MTIRDFITQNRAEIDSAINRTLCHVPREASCYCPKSRTEHDHDPKPLNNEDRRQWIANDEGLYNWARSEGVSV